MAIRRSGGDGAGECGGGATLALRADVTGSARPPVRRRRRCRPGLARVVAGLAVARLLLGDARSARAEVRIGTVDVGGERVRDDADDDPAGDPAPDPDGTAFVTVVDARRPSARVVSVADLVEREAGVHVRSRGGLGAFTSVSIRGSDSGEVAVFLDGVPLDRASAAGIDLAQLPVDGLERVEIYRGVPPVELGADVIGGAIHLVSRRGGRRPAWRATAGFGSFGARSASVGWGGARRGLTLDASAAYHGATGDFPYYSKGRLLDTSEDGPALRRSNGFDQLAVDLSVGTARGAGGPGLTVGAHGFLRQQGVPAAGAAAAEARAAATLSTGRAAVDATLRAGSPDVDVRLRLDGFVERTLYRNLDDPRRGVVGPGWLEGLTIGGGGAARAEVVASAREVVTALAELRVERYQGRDLLHLVTAPAPPSSRVRGALALADEIRLAADRVALSPALRLDGVVSDVSVAAAPGSRAALEARSVVGDAFVSPRLGARLRVAEWLSLQASAGRFVRLPTLVELFGDGAFFAPRPSLRPEIALGGDAGLRLARPRRSTGAILSAALELAGFARALDDAIGYVPVAGAIAAVNVGPARVVGVEARARASLGSALALTVEYTLVDSANLADDPGVHGQALPGRPRHELTVRLDGAAGPFAAFYEAHAQGEVLRDAQGYNRLPARSLHAAGVSAGPFAHLPLTLAVEVRNLLDLRVVDLPLGGTAHAGETTPYPLVDVFDYPLPGRAVYLTLALKT